MCVTYVSCTCTNCKRVVLFDLFISHVQSYWQGWVLGIAYEGVCFLQNPTDGKFRLVCDDCHNMKAATILIFCFSHLNVYA
jgi:hypothetical protein